MQEELEYMSNPLENVLSIPTPEALKKSVANTCIRAVKSIKIQPGAAENDASEPRFAVALLSNFTAQSDKQSLQLKRVLVIAGW